MSPPAGSASPALHPTTSHGPPLSPSAYCATCNEHVCVRPRRRSSTSSSISLPIRRRDSTSTFVAPPVSERGGHLEPVQSEVDLSEKREEEAEIDRTTSSSSKRPLSISHVSQSPTSTETVRGAPSSPISTEPKLTEKLASHLPWTHAGRRKRADPESGGKTELEWNWGSWSAENVASAALVPALVTQALATGLLDATTYADFKTFASNQTGNAILLTLSAVGTARILLVLTAVSFGGFLGGAFLFGHIGHFLGVRRRLWLITSTFLQTMMLVVAAILFSPHGPTATNLGGKHEWVVLLLFAMMSGAQVAMARQSSCQELPTAPMTSTFVDFVADHYLFAAWSDPRATSRNRRLSYVIAMIGGSFVGACMHRWSASWVVIVVAVGVKCVALLLLCIAAAEEEES